MTNRLLEHAIEDINNYLQAVKWWSAPPEGYSDGYLLILILSNRSRGRQAFNLMETQLSPTYLQFKEELLSLWSEAEVILKGQVFKDLRRLRATTLNEVIPRLNDLKNELHQIRDISQDGDIIGDFDWAARNISDIAHDFLLHFQDLYLTKEELKESPLSKDEIESLQQRFNEIEVLFKGCFGYFHPVSDFLLSLQEREYNLDVWWLKEVPKFEDVQEEEDIPVEVVERFQKLFKASTEKVISLPCPDSELVISYAFGELTDKENIMNVRHHILKCCSCLDLVMDVRLADSEVMGLPSKAVDESLIKLLGEYKAKKSEGLQKVFGWMMMILTVFLMQRQRKLMNLSPRASSVEEPVNSEDIENPIELSVKADERGMYILLPKSDSNLIIKCNSPESYEKLYLFIEREAIAYWAGCAEKNTEELEYYEPKRIPNSLKLMEIKEEEIKSIVIGISGKIETLEKGIKALQNKDSESISNLNIIWLKCSLE